MLRWFLRRPRLTWRLLLLGLTAALASAALWAEYHLRAARQALEHRTYDEARRHLNCYLRLWPRSSTAYLLATRCARASGDFDEARRLLAACQELGADPEAVSLEADLLDAQRGTLGRAGEEALCYRVERGHPQTPAILEALAAGYLYSCRPDDASACLERWLAYSPGDSQALYLRGLTWEAMGALDKAGEHYRQAVRRDPDHVPAKERLAEYLIYTGQYEEAAGLFQQLLDRRSGDAGALLGLARCRRSQGRSDEARRLLDELLARDSSLTPALVERARVAQEEGDFAAAETWFRRALARDPWDHDACYGLGQCLRALGRASEAGICEERAAQIESDLKRLRQLQEQMAKEPNDLQLPYEAGQICLRNGQKEEARRWFRNVLARYPRHEGARRGLEQVIRKGSD